MDKKVLAYVLMEIEMGMTDSVVAELKKIDEAVRVAVTTGVYDVIILIETEDLEQLYEVTVNKVHAIPGIRDTTTAVVEKMIP